MSKGWPIVGDGNPAPLYQTSEAPRQGLAGLRDSLRDIDVQCGAKFF